MPGVQQVTDKRWLLICCHGFIYLLLVAWVLLLLPAFPSCSQLGGVGFPLVASLVSACWWTGFCIAAPGLGSASSVVVVHGLVALWQVGSSGTRAQTRVSCIGRWILYHWDTREAPSLLLLLLLFGIITCLLKCILFFILMAISPESHTLAIIASHLSNTGWVFNTNLWLKYIWLIWWVSDDLCMCAQLLQVVSNSLQPHGL